MFLAPLAWVFCVAAWLRRQAYRRGWLEVRRLPVPVIVVGNLTVGGTGKTPLIVWLAIHLRSLGYRPGIVARGYRGKSRHWPRAVVPDSDPAMVGDEPVLAARRAGCPVWVAPDRFAAGRMLLETSGCDIILSDDGLQHYALGRDIEIVVIDGERRFGNGYCLPAGPLRERPAARLRSVDLIVVNGAALAGEYTMRLSGQRLVNLADPSRQQDLAMLRDRPVEAVAGIGNPQRFFRRLREVGALVREHPFADHHLFTRQDLPEQGVVVMTEKDAVKCAAFARPEYWYLPVQAELDAGFAQRLEQLLKGLNYG